jgi:predicted RNA-binding Zn-ribbon protein involved in translation (DUF1610 family)
MTDKTIELDAHRGMAAQKATDLRREVAEVAAARSALRTRQDALEHQLLAGPAATWNEAAEKAAYLMQLFATTAEARDPRRQRLIANVLDDFRRLSQGDEPEQPEPAAGVKLVVNEIAFQCPNCGHDLTQTIPQLEQSGRMQCVGCGVGINIDTDRFADASREIRDALDMVPPEITIKFFR